ncbi:hypothetical protein NZK32_15075, partial [Cyanobium sp. FGCU-52]|nr:hypothetical protein [Cyanobium sp. FGCU52]
CWNQLWCSGSGILSKPYLGEIIFLQGRTAEGCASFRKGVGMSSLQEGLQEAKPPLDPAYLKACR